MARGPPRRGVPAGEPMSRPRVLVLSVAVPWPAIGGGRTRTARLVDAVRAMADVTVVAFTYDDESYEEPPTGVTMLTVPYRTPPLHDAMHDEEASRAAAALDVLADDDHEPWMSSWYDSREMTQLLTSLPREGWTASLVEGSDLGRYIPDLPPAPVVLDFMDVCAALYERVADLCPTDENRREAERVRRFEGQVGTRADHVLVVSELERLRAEQLLGIREAVVVPNGVDWSRWAAPRGCAREPGRIVFTGSMDYPPNVEAVLDFAREVLPRVIAEVPWASFHVVGTSPSAEVRALSEGAVQVHGRVDDVAEHIARAELAVVPITSGGGTRLKVLEAAATSTAIVSTTLGAEGLDLHDGEHLRIADDWDDFARAVIELLGDPESRLKLGQAARDVAHMYDWDVVTQPLVNLIMTLDAASRASGR